MPAIFWLVAVQGDAAVPDKRDQPPRLILQLFSCLEWRWNSSRPQSHADSKLDAAHRCNQRLPYVQGEIPGVIHMRGSRQQRIRLRRVG